MRDTSPKGERYGARHLTESEITSDLARVRLEYLRSQLDAECISMGELIELQNLAPYIEAGDVQLAEAAGIDEQEFAMRSDDHLESVTADRRSRESTFPVDYLATPPHQR